MCKFYADGSRSYYNHFFRLLRKCHCLTVSDDLFSVLGKVWQHSRTRTCSDDDVVGIICSFLSILSGNEDFFSSLYLSKTADHIDFIFFHQKGNPFAHSFSHSATSLDDGLKIFVDGFGFQSVFIHMFQIIIYLCTFQKCFCRNTSPVQADSSQAFFFDDSRFESQLRCSNSGYIASRSSTDNNYVVFHVF